MRFFVPLVEQTSAGETVKFASIEEEIMEACVKIYISIYIKHLCKLCKVIGICTSRIVTE